MKRVCCLIFIICLLIPRVQSQSTGVDSTALLILDRMSDVMTELQSCRLKVETVYDIPDPDLGLIKHSDNADIILQGPDKMLMSLSGDKGQQTFLFNGQTLSYYSLDDNRYAQLAIPGSILNMADTMWETFGVELYVIDFFFPSFFDDLLANSTTIAYLGLTPVNGNPCYHIAGVTARIGYQIWIRQGPLFLPEKAVIVYNQQEGSPQFEARYLDWEINPTFPAAIFDFTVPPHAIKSSFKPVDQ